MVLRLKLLSSLLILTRCAAYPIFLLGEIKTKCFSVTSPQGMVLKVAYDAPDLVTDTTDTNYGPVYLSVSVTPSKRVFDTSNHPSLVSERLKPTSQLLKEQKGEITHTVEVDGEAKICVRASAATHQKRMRFGIAVDVKEPKVDKGSANAGPEELDEHLSHMEQEMRRIQNGMKMVLSEADFSKSRESVFHQQTESMHAASIFWPIVQVCVLIMTGFTQARHIVTFFQSRRII